MTIKKKVLSSTFALAVVAAGAVVVNMATTAEALSYPGPGVVTGAITVHDPSAVKKPDGTYIIAHTGDNIVLKTSTDRTAFKEAGVAFPNGASWTTSYTGGSKNLWAPDISYHNSKYWMYYSASTFGSNKSAIFLATSTTGASGSWTNNGLVIASTTSDNYNAIDPNLNVDASGNWWLSFGSFWDGIRQVKISSSTGLRADTTIRSLASRGGGAIEAPFLFHHGSYYYLYVSFDLCCKGASSTYRIMVGRSTSPNGPFVDKSGKALTSGGGTEILAGAGSIHGPGGQSVIADSDADVLVYHYYDANGTAKLGINLLTYSSDWPVAY
jgi:arabinan endo-1,5-alpha-L-arabinosidase